MQLDQGACVTGRFVGVRLFEFRCRDDERRAFDNVGRVAGEFKIAMVRRAAGRNELFVVDLNRF